MRNILTNIAALLMANKEFRFSKEYRYGTTLWHRIVYAMISTPTANIKADKLSDSWRCQ